MKDLCYSGIPPFSWPHISFDQDTVQKWGMVAYCVTENSQEMKSLLTFFSAFRYHVGDMQKSIAKSLRVGDIFSAFVIKKKTGNGEDCGTYTITVS